VTAWLRRVTRLLLQRRRRRSGLVCLTCAPMDRVDVILPAALVLCDRCGKTIRLGVAL